MAVFVRKEQQNNKRQISTNLPQTLQANSGSGPSELTSEVTTGAGEGDFLFLATCPGPDPFVPVPATLRFFLFGSVGFMKLTREQVWLIFSSNYSLGWGRKRTGKKRNM